MGPVAILSQKAMPSVTNYVGGHAAIQSLNRVLLAVEVEHLSGLVSKLWSERPRSGA